MIRQAMQELSNMYQKTMAILAKAEKQETSQPTQTTKPKETIKVVSLDWDGCAGAMVDHSVRHAEICAKCEGKPEYIPKHHRYVQGLKEHIQKNLDNEGKESIVLCGSARQDHVINNMNKMNKHNEFKEYRGTEYAGMIPTLEEVDAFHQFPLVVEMFNKTLGTNATFVPLLYPDQDDEPGTTMYRDKFREASECKIPLDSLKVNLLKFQANWLSKKYPENNIEIAFYDDRMDILQELRDEAAPCMPDNVTLKLYRADWYAFTTKDFPDPVQEIITRVPRRR